MPDNLDFLAELRRKTIHLATSVIPLLYLFLFSRYQMTILVVTFAALLLLGEALRMKVPFFKRIYQRVFTKLLRSNEKNEHINGATYLAVGFALTILIFERNTAVAAMLFLSLADSLAAVIGKSIGKHALLNKSWEGSLTFFLLTATVTWYFFENFFVVIFVAFVTTLIELLPLKVNDNISVPMGGALAILISRAFF